MPTSAKPKSPRGENGPESSELLSEVTDNLLPEVAATADCGNPDTQEKPDPASDPAPAAAAVADVSGDNADKHSVPTLSPSDRKLADRMTRDIARHLGLGGSSRSVRI